MQRMNIATFSIRRYRTIGWQLSFLFDAVPLCFLCPRNHLLQYKNAACIIVRDAVYKYGGALLNVAHVQVEVRKRYCSVQESVGSIPGAGIWGKVGPHSILKEQPEWNIMECRHMDTSRGELMRRF